MMSNLLLCVLSSILLVVRFSELVVCQPAPAYCASFVPISKSSSSSCPTESTATVYPPLNAASEWSCSNGTAQSGGLTRITNTSSYSYYLTSWSYITLTGKMASGSYSLALIPASDGFCVKYVGSYNQMKLYPSSTPLSTTYACWSFTGASITAAMNVSLNSVGWTGAISCDSVQAVFGTLYVYINQSYVFPDTPMLSSSSSSSSSSTGGSGPAGGSSSGYSNFHSFNSNNFWFMLMAWTITSHFVLLSHVIG